MPHPPSCPTTHRSRQARITCGHVLRVRCCRRRRCRPVRVRPRCHSSWWRASHGRPARQTLMLRGSGGAFHEGIDKARDGVIVSAGGGGAIGGASPLPTHKGTQNIHLPLRLGLCRPELGLCRPEYRYRPGESKEGTRAVYQTSVIQLEECFSCHTASSVGCPYPLVMKGEHEKPHCPRLCTVAAPIHLIPSIKGGMILQ